MIALPAIDLRDGACVQLVGGSYDHERIRLTDPIAVAHNFLGLGFHSLHVVDLDAATDRGSNAELVGALLDVDGLAVQVGGGIRTRERIAELLDRGAARVVVGTRALEDEAWLREVADAHPSRLVLAADVRGREVLTRGWARSTSHDIAEVLHRLAGVPLAGVLVTAVHLEGQQRGTDLALMEAVVRASPWPVQASGGVTSLEDLRALATLGVAASVIGMALYTGTLDAAAAAKEFGA